MPQQQPAPRVTAVRLVQGSMSSVDVIFSEPVRVGRRADGMPSRIPLALSDPDNGSLADVWNQDQVSATTIRMFFNADVEEFNWTFQGGTGAVVTSTGARRIQPGAGVVIPP